MAGRIRVDKGRGIYVYKTDQKCIDKLKRGKWTGGRYGIGREWTGGRLGLLARIKSNKLVKKVIDVEAKASLQPSSILQEMGQRCLRGNRPAHITVAKSQASATRDPREEPSKKAQTQDKPSHSSHPHSSRPENVGKTSNRKEKKEKKK